LQHAHRPIGAERIVKRLGHGLERRQRIRRHRRIFQRHRHVIGIADAGEAVDLAAGAEAQGHRFLGGDRALGAGKPFAAGHTSARQHILGEGRDRREVLLDARRDEGAGALLARQQPRIDQAVQRLAHGDARDAVGDREIALGRQRFGRRQYLPLDRVPEHTLQLLIQRRGVSLGQPSYAFDEHAG